MKKLIILFILLVLCGSAEAYETKANFVHGTLLEAIDSGDTTGEVIDIALGTNSGAFPSCSASNPCKLVVYDASCSQPSTCANREVITLSNYTDAATDTVTILSRNAETPNCSSCSFAIAAKWFIGGTAFADATSVEGYDLGTMTNGYLCTADTSNTEIDCALQVASTNTASTVVQRDGSGNFSAGTITAALTGNASTATALADGSTTGWYKFSGTCNGSSDNTAALQAWLASGYKKLYLPKGAGECMTSTNLTLPDETIIYAEPGATIKASDNINVLTIGNHSEVYNLTIDGGGYGDATATGTPTIVGGHITAIALLTTGQNVWTAPDVIITGDGSNAAAHVTIAGGVVTGFVVDNQGSGYTTATVTVNGGETCFWWYANHGSYMDNVEAKYCGYHGLAASKNVGTGAVAHDNYVGTLRTSYCGHRGVNISQGAYNNHIDTLYGNYNGKGDYLVGWTSYANSLGMLYSTNIGNASIWLADDVWGNSVHGANISSPATSSNPMVILATHSHDNTLSNIVIDGAKRGFYLDGSQVNTTTCATYSLTCTQGHTTGNVISNFTVNCDGDAASNGIELQHSDLNSYYVTNNSFSNGHINNCGDGIDDITTPTTYVATDNSFIGLETTGTTTVSDISSDNALIYSDNGILYLSGNDIKAQTDLSTLELSNSGGNVIFTSANLSDSSASNAKLRAQVAGSSGGDPLVSWLVSGVTEYVMGLDNSDNDAFKLSFGAALGTSDLIRMDSDGNFKLTGAFQSPLIIGNASSALTGSIDPTASTSVTGVDTLFTSQLKVGDFITVSGETRSVVAISSDTSLTVNRAFSDNGIDTDVDRLPIILLAKDYAGNPKMTLNYAGGLTLGDVTKSNVTSTDLGYGLGVYGSTNTTSRISSINTGTSSTTGGGYVAVIQDDGAATDATHRLGGFIFQGSTGTTHITGTGANITAVAETAFTDNGTSATNTNSALIFSTVGAASATVTERMRIEGDGDILMAGTKTDGSLAYPLCWDGSGSSYWGGCTLGTGNQTGVVCYNSTTNIFSYETDGACTTSSRESKYDIKNYYGGLLEISEIQPVTFKYKDTPTEERIGLIADDLPDSRMISYTKDGKVDGFYEHSIIATLVNAVKELKAEIDELKSKCE